MSDKIIQHDHSCYCGTGSHVPHKTNTTGCVRVMTKAPVAKWGDKYLVDGHVITGFTLREQRGYHQHPCGCWSRWVGSKNSIEA